MILQQFKKIIELIKRTNDKVIVFDPESPDDAYVVMSLDRYAKMADENKDKGSVLIEKKDLTDEDLTDKINREISELNNSDKGVEMEEENGPGKTWKIPPTVIKKAENIE